MALYLGSYKYKLYLGDNIPYKVLTTKDTNINAILLLSSDGYVLKDSNNVYLSVQEEGE